MASFLKKISTANIFNIYSFQSPPPLRMDGLPLDKLLGAPLWIICYVYQRANTQRCSQGCLRMEGMDRGMTQKTDVSRKENARGILF